MDLSSLILPSLSQFGQKNTSKKKLERPQFKNFLSNDFEIYHRAGLVLPTEYELSPIPDATEAIAASDDNNKRLALPQSFLDIETALAEDYAVVVSIEIYQEFPLKGEVLQVPDIDKEILGIVQIVLAGYDRQNQLFLALTEDNKLFTIAYNYVADELVAFDLWAIAR